MIINEMIFNCSLEDILLELQKQLKINDIPLLQKMRDSGDDIMVQCPYHGNGQERKPSAGISKQSGIFHCFACGEVHTLPEVISYCFGKEDILGKFGWNWLLKNFATISVEKRPALKLDMSREKERENPEYVSEEELDSYRYTHPYMYKRRLTDEIIEMFDVGYDRNSKCITFPVRDIDGNTLFVARRSVQTKWFNYPAGVEKPVYGLFELQKTDSVKEVIICESIIDALTCWVYGKPAVALNGLGTEAQFGDLRRFSARKYIIATDMDEAGLKARNRIKKGISNKLVTQYVWDPSIAKDINDMEKDYFLRLDEVF